MNRKPLGKKSYGSIPHLPASRLGPSDKQANPGQVRIATEKVRDKHDIVIVQEKLDGSNVAVAKLNGNLIPLTRAGYQATSSPHLQHQLWHDWAWEQYIRFDRLLLDDEWASGEWCIQAHGTLYNFEQEPFFLFDIFRDGKRITFSELQLRNMDPNQPFLMPTVIHCGPTHCSIEHALSFLGTYGHHGAIDSVEGAVWRVERQGRVDFLTKYVRPEKTDGRYLFESTPVWNSWNCESNALRGLLS